MTIGRDTLTKAETITVAAIESGLPRLVDAHELIATFHGMVRGRSHADLAAWITQAETSLVASFARGHRGLSARAYVE
jgi:hypothetical protein